MENDMPLFGWVFVIGPQTALLVEVFDEVGGESEHLAALFASDFALRVRPLGVEQDGDGQRQVEFVQMALKLEALCGVGRAVKKKVLDVLCLAGAVRAVWRGD